MTLYWWMHWFWITSLNFTALLLWGSTVQGAPSPFLPVVQNGHQNGPYMSKAVLEHPDKSLIDPSKEDGYVSHSPEYAATTDETASGHSLRPHSRTSSVRVPDTYLDEISESMSDEYAVPQTTHEPLPSPTHFPFKNPPVAPVRHVGGTVRTLVAPDTNDDDDTSHGFPPHFPRAPAKLITGAPSAPSSSAHSADSMITWISTVPSPALTRDPTDERPMGDGPYLAPTDSFTGSLSHQSRAGWKQLPATSTEAAAAAAAKGDDDALSTEKSTESRGKSVNREKTADEQQAGTGTSTTQAAVLYVTPLSASDASWAAKTQVSERRADGHVNGSNAPPPPPPPPPPSTPVHNANSSVVQVGLDWNASVVGVARSLARTPGADAMPAVSRERVAQPDKREGGLDAASITGIAMGIVTAAGLVGAVSFVLYRRRYLNKPQTLNDSNPDSSGYLDDSTLREHSEEMYSLDNDSFLNSLEAMTIQNYWTDSVKHTKL